MTDCLSEPNPDFATILHAIGGRYVACIMRYRADVDQYDIHVSWGPVKRAEAETKAQTWAREHKIEYRP